MFNPLELKKRFVQSQIEKSFYNEIEKAHNVGDPHPRRGDLFWTEYKPGKFDWRPKKARYNNMGDEKSDDSGKEQKFKQSFKDASDDVLQKVVGGKIQASSEEKKWAQDILDERKKSDVKSAAGKKVIDLLKVANSKYTDIDKVVAWKTDKGNWAIDYDGANTGVILNGSKLSEAELKRAGVKIEGANANSKKDSNLINDIKSNEDAFIEACGLSNIKRVVSIRETPTSVFIKYENNSGQEQEFPLTKNVANSVLKEVKAKKSKKADPRDKVAQKAGFKDYKEMMAHQDYVTAKSLLKKPSTKDSLKRQLEADVAKYEKEHANVIKRVTEKKDGKKNTDSSGRAVYYKTLAERFDKTGECKSTDALIAVYKEDDPRKNIEAARALRKYIMKDLNYRDNDDWTKTLNEYKKQRLNADKAGDRDAYKAYDCAYQAVKDRIAKDAE